MTSQYVSTPSTLYSGGPRLSVKVLSASGLPKRSIFRSPDATAYIRVDSVERGHTDEKKRSRNPRWNKRFIVAVKHSSTIEIEIVHQNNRENMIGSAEIRLEELTGLHLGPVSLTLRITKKRSNGEPPLKCGKLSVELCCLRGNTDTRGQLPPGWEWRLDDHCRTFYFDHNTEISSHSRPPSHMPNEIPATAFPGLSWLDKQGLLPPGWTWKQIPSAGRQYVNHNNSTTTWVRPPAVTHDDPTGSNAPRFNDYKERRMRVAGLLQLTLFDFNNDRPVVPRLPMPNGPPKDDTLGIKRACAISESHLSGHTHELKKPKKKVESLLKIVSWGSLAPDPEDERHEPPWLSSKGFGIKLQREQNPPSSNDVFLSPHESIPSARPSNPNGVTLSSASPQGDMPILVLGEAEITLTSSEPIDVSGRFCDLFAGTHSTAGKVALKRLRVLYNQGQPNEEVRSFMREARNWATLNHDHILQFLGTVTISGRMFLVSPFIDNGTLSRYIEAHPGTDRPKFLRETASALVYLHQKGVVHGDIKACNILVSSDIRALVCDFGLTKIMDAATSTDVKGAGSIRWQSPELLLGEGKAYSSDVYAFAMTIYEVLSGNLPFHDVPNNAAVIHRVMQGERPPTLPPGSLPGLLDYAPLWYVATRCWVKESDRRPTMIDAADWMSDAVPVPQNWNEADGVSLLESLYRGRTFLSTSENSIAGPGTPRRRSFENGAPVAATAEAPATIMARLRSLFSRSHTPFRNH